MIEFRPEETAFMRRAIDLSVRGSGRVQPNPLVGAVIVDQGGRVVGEGHHAEFGGAHAEVEALRQAGSAARGATMYVTLEPCVHHGKTPPCTSAIAEAGIRRIVYANADPNPAAAGGGSELTRLGVVVDAGLLGEEAARENSAFLWWQVTGEPFVALKLAASLDGRIAADSGTRTRVSGREAGIETMRLRAAADAIMVGSGTARDDDPLLTVREVPQPRIPPLRVVLDRAADLPVTSQLASTADRVPVLILVGEEAEETRIESLREAGVKVERLPGAKTGHGLDLRAVLLALRDRGCRSVLCEGGAKLADAMLAAGLVHRLHWHLAPKVFGAAGIPALEAPLSGNWKATRSRLAGDDVLVEWDHERLSAVLRGI
jgi:diaminohydroxyphosphoribosylaminopyrimidine deaminase/5-amino-6-(5-phosphoribosylamino)uracil reductase